MTESVPPTPEYDVYDLVIEGTGLIESILAAAAARAGKKVIHIDKNPFYGSHWAALSITDLDHWVQQHSSDSTQPYFGKVNWKMGSHTVRQR
jgi:RAB protein geranylgeranyltransferase component A